MSYLSIDNLIGVQPTTSSSSQLQASQIDVYNGTTNFHRITSSASSPLQTITIPNASGTITLNTASQTVTNKMNHAQVGSATDPSYSFVGDVDTGFFRSAANTIGIATNGVSRVTIDDTNINTTVPIRGSLGSNANPTYSFAGGTGFSNCGFYSSGANIITCTIAGANHCRFSTAGFQLFNTGGFKAPDGTVALTGYNFSSEAGSGMYLAGVGNLSFSANGTRGMGVESQGIRLYGPTSGNNLLYNASKFSYYEEYPGQTTFTGGNATTAVIDFKITRVGNVCTLTMERWPVSYTNTNGSSVAYVSNSQFPIRFQKASFIAFPVLCYVGGARQICLVYTGTTTPSGDGNLTFILETTNIPSGTSFQAAEMTISWNL